MSMSRSKMIYDYPWLAMHSFYSDVKFNKTKFNYTALAWMIATDWKEKQVGETN